RSDPHAQHVAIRYVRASRDYGPLRVLDIRASDRYADRRCALRGSHGTGAGARVRRGHRVASPGAVASVLMARPVAPLRSSLQIVARRCKVSICTAAMAVTPMVSHG